MRAPPEDEDWFPREAGEGVEMNGKLFGFSGLALVAAAALGLASLRAVDVGFAAVGDDDAGQVLGGAYCPKMLVTSTNECGGGVGKSTGTCPYLNKFTTDNNGIENEVVSSSCVYCCTTCGSGFAAISNCN